MFRSIIIANFFILKGCTSGIHITPMKLQKLIYFAHGWYLGLFNKSLINENFQAWPYGPVIPSIYHTFKDYRNSSITDVYQIASPSSPLDIETTNFLNFIWDLYKDYNAIELSNLTHVSKSPWDIVREENKNSPFDNDIIENELIKKYFKEIHIDTSISISE